MESAAHRFSDQMGPLGLRQCFQIPRLQHLEHLGQRDTARRRWRCSDDLPAVVFEADRSTFTDAVGGKFLRGPDTAFGFDASKKFIGDLALIETRMAFRSQQLESPRQIGLTQHFTLRRRCAVGEEYAAGSGIAFHHLTARRVALGEAGIHRKAVPRGTYGRGQ